MDGSDGNEATRRGTDGVYLGSDGWLEGVFGFKGKELNIHVYIEMLSGLECWSLDQIPRFLYT